MNFIWRKPKILLVFTVFASTAIGLEPERQRNLVLQAMQARPADPWSRGSGHVPFGYPGSVETAKAYLEPGGSFSPSVRSFGISFWIIGAGGKVITTSDQMPLDQLHQRYVWPVESRSGVMPAVEVTTPYYRAMWTINPRRDYDLALTPSTKHGEELAVVVRSVGPAGGPITKLSLTGHELKVNTRWTVSTSGTLFVSALGREGDQDWITRISKQATWSGSDGWGYARFTVAHNRPVTLSIHDANETGKSTGLPFETTRSGVTINVPDPRFQASIDAQVANLMMAAVRNETRPGEPVNYPLPWLRDGAYELVALARAGRIDTAEFMGEYFAEHDFFGGFGSEADSPGLSLWALGQVSQLANDRHYDVSLWPSVQRKALLIEDMLTAKRQLRIAPYGPIVPKYRDSVELSLVCDAAKNGLIVGRMDWQSPLLFVNAVSYRGLLSAAELAERTGKKTDSDRWRSVAKKLRASWMTGLATPERNNDRTYTSALWPTWVLAQNSQQFESDLKQRWSKRHDSNGRLRQKPLWTYFDLAEAHQWLFLGHQWQAWNILDWYLAHDQSAGLFTWWEGNGEENTSHGWDDVRGWVRPANVTPHYWTAAEMLLLELDMMAYVDQRGSEPSLVIGAGLKPEWLSKPMSVAGLRTEGGIVDWSWSNEQMSVTVHGPKMAVRLGSIFPAATRMNVSYSSLPN